jgi:hypothetical protein
MTFKNSNSSRAPRATLAQRAIAAAGIKLRDRQGAEHERQSWAHTLQGLHD